MLSSRLLGAISWQVARLLRQVRFYAWALCQVGCWGVGPQADSLGAQPPPPAPSCYFTHPRGAVDGVPGLVVQPKASHQLMGYLPAPQPLAHLHSQVEGLSARAGCWNPWPLAPFSAHLEVSVNR